jgi:hypothetical protein
MRASPRRRSSPTTLIAALLAVFVLAPLLVVGPSGPAAADPWDVVPRGTPPRPWVELPFEVHEFDTRLKPLVNPHLAGYRCEYEVWVVVDFAELERRGADVARIHANVSADDIVITGPWGQRVLSWSPHNPPPSDKQYDPGVSYPFGGGKLGWLVFQNRDDTREGACDREDNQNHLYDDDGQLHATRIAQEATQTKVYAPRSLFAGMVAAIDYVGRHQEAPVALDEEVRVQVSVRPSELFEGGVTAVRRADPDQPLLQVPSQFEVVSQPTDAELDDLGDLAEGQVATLDWVLRATTAGDFALRTAELAGLDANGAETRARPATKTGSVTGVVVDITAAPERFQLGANDHGNIAQVTVTVRNLTDDELEHVTLQGPLDWGPAPGSPLEVGLRFADREALAELFGNAEVLEIGPVAPGEEASFTYQLEAFAAADAVLRQLVMVSGPAGGSTEAGRGRLVVVDDPVVEFGVGLDGAQSLVSGQPVRLAGVVRNVTDVEGEPDSGTDVHVVAWPMLEGNAGNGFLTDAAPGGPTADGLQVITLAPGEQADLHGLLATVADPSPSTATVAYQVAATVVDEDGEPVPVGSDQIAPAEGYPAGTEVSVALAPTPLVPDDPKSGCGQFSLVVARWHSPTWCGIVDGLPRFVEGWVGLARYLEEAAGIPDVEDVKRWQIKFLFGLAQAVARNQEAIDPNSAAMQAIWDQTAAELQELGDTGLLAIEGIPDLAAHVRDATIAKLDLIATAYHQGDWDTLRFAFGQFLGENPDLAIEAVVLASAGTRVLRQTTGANAAVRDAIEAAARAEADDAAAAIARGMADEAPLEKIIPNGASLADDVVRKGWGASTVDLVRIKALAAAENVMILFRSRAEASIELLERGWAWTKPEALKIKSVDEIDIEFLGYRPAALGRLELVEPPPALRQAIEDLVESVGGNTKAVTDELFDAQVGPALDAYMDVLRGRHPELASNADLAAEVRSRLRTRVEEWPVYDKLITDGATIDVGFRRKPQGIDPGDAGEIARPAGLRRTPVEDVPDVRPDGRPGGGPGPDETRRYWEIELEDFDDLTGESGFRWVTGDIDVVAILDAAGGFITDELKRDRIYRNLQRLIGMRHGESFSFAPSNAYRSKFLRTHVGPDAPALVAVHASGEVTAARFAENLAITEFANPGLRLSDPTGDFIPLLGARFQRVVDQTVFSRLVWNPLLANLEAAARYYLPQFWWRFVDGLGEDEQPEPSRDGDAPVVKPDGAGGLLRWTPEGGWEAISVADAVAEGLAGVLDVLPQSAVSEHAPAGSATIEIGELGSLGDFAPGDVVVVDPGGPNQEIRTVVALGSLVLDRPLDHEHLPGELVSVLTPAPACDPSRFNDVGAGHAFCAEITWLASSGITGGYADGSFGAGNPVTRQAMAAFLYRAAGSPDGPDPACHAGRFNDVGAAHPFCGEITWLADEAITTGYGDGSFGAASPVTRQAMAAFLQRHATR